MPSTTHARLPLHRHDDRRRAYTTLKGVLHTLRDRLSPQEAAQFGAQLPMLVRGFYYRGSVPRMRP